MVNNKLEFTGSEFFDILREFQDRVKEGSFKKTVPYDIWKKLKVTQKPVSFDFIEDYQLGEIFYDENKSYSEYFYEEGLIAFLYDKWVANVKEEDYMMTIGTNESTLAANIAEVTAVSNKIDSTNQLSISDYITGGYVNTKTETEVLKEDVEELKRKLAILNIDTTSIHSKNVENEKNIEILEDKVREIDYQTLAYVNSRIDDLVNSIEDLKNKSLYFEEMIYNLHTELEDQKAHIARKADKIKCEVEVNESKENKRMKNFNFDFGPCTNDNVRMSMYGLAVKNAAGTYVSLNPSTKEVVDVDIFNFDGGKYLFKMPVAIKDIAVGDVIIHNKKPMFVEGVSARGDILAIDPVAGERKEVMLTRSPFNFNYATKVVNLFGAGAGGMATPNADNPFGNMLPFVLMNEEDGDIDPMMLMFMMNQNGGANTSAFGNPMMMYFLMKDKGEIDPMMMFMMMNQQQQHTCQCGCAENKA